MSRRIVIRMDDICPKMKKIPFQRMRKLLESYGFISYEKTWLYYRRRRKNCKKYIC